MNLIEAFGPALLASAILFLFCFRPSRRMRLQAARIAERWRDATRRKALTRMRDTDLMFVRVAYHEAGHALLQWRSPYALRGLIVTVEERSGLTRYAYPAMHSTHVVWDNMAIYLAGLASESLRFRTHDLCGRSGERFLSAAIALAKLIHRLEQTQGRRYEPKWKGTIPPGDGLGFEEFMQGVTTPLPLDPRVREMLKEAYCKARHTLRSQGAALDRLAALALEKRRITGMHVRRIAGPRPPKRTTS